eukprot:CAMPEP_0204897532 /NCGR_PEP_ID=MMETSP1397-20131031/789_1 /ASSEMBLY_ACC=CAM_ASM_000891 /TAXON_ID=49980 /ORGANISM="Climacostomum Climacostomum virens, Strain Stock W-24" /LENGTH=2044 /DNA_ID=CAMNT_0052065299 /DNA_START=1064 /DNA_END=7198 /DNA_ORIENTATION=-
MAIIMNSIWFIFVGLVAAGTFRPDLGKPAPIEVHSANAGISGVTYHFYVENESAVEKGNYLMIVFPSQYADIVLASPCQINNVDIACTKVSTNIVSITLTSKLAALQRLTIRVPGITNPTSAGGTGFFNILTKYAIGGQIIDFNDQLGTVGIANTPSSVTVSVARASGGSEKVGGSFNLVVSFQTTVALDIGTKFRLKVPSEFKLSSTFTCTAVANGAAAAISGPFTCSYNSISKDLLITGLSKAITSNYACAISISSFTNPLYVQTAGASSYKLDILKPGTLILYATGSANSLAVTAGAIENVTHEPYFTGAQLTKSNLLYTKLSFSVTNPVAEGGTIVIDYSLAVDVDTTYKTGCWAMSGINPKSDGTQPVCTATDGSDTITLSGFGAIAAGSKIVIVNCLQLGTTSLTNVDITTKDSSSRIIDDDNGAQGGLTIVDKPTITDASVSFTTTDDAGSQSPIQITFKPDVDLAIGATIRIYMPKGFVLPSNASAACKQDATSLTSCTLAGYTLTMVTVAAITATAGDNFTILSTATSTGWVLPSLPSSIDNPYEWQVEVTPNGATSFSCFGSLLQTVSDIVFDKVTSTGATSIVSEIQSPNLYTPYTFTIKIDRALTTSATMIPLITISFGTRNVADDSDSFPLDLGTGLTASGAIACKYLAGLSSYSASVPLKCTLTPATSASTTNFATLMISGFKDITAGTLVRIKIFIKNAITASKTDHPITLTTFTRTYNQIMTILQTETFLFTTQAAPTLTFTTKTISSRTSKLISSDTNITLKARLAGASNSVDGDMLVLTFPKGWVFNDSQNFKVNDNVGYNTEVYNNAYAPTIIGKLSTAAKLNGSSGTDNTIFLENLTNYFYGNMGSGAISLGFVDGTSSTSYKKYVEVVDTTTTLEGTVGATFTASIETNSLSRLAGDVTYTFVITTAYDIPAGGRILVIFPAGYDPTYSTCKTTSVVKDLSASSPKTCTVNVGSLTATVASFAAIPKKSTFRVVVYTLKNPDVATTSTFKVYTLYDSDTTHIIEKQESGLTLTLTSQLSPASVTVSRYTMFPTSSGAIADLIIEYTLDVTVPNNGVLMITLPGEFTLPSLSTDNCILNFMYSSCSKSGTSIITLIPMAYFPAGYRHILMIPGVTVPSSDVKNNPISFKATWNGLTLLQNPTTPSTSFYFTPTSASSTAITAALKVWPKNAGEMSNHEFTIKFATAITTSHALVIWFPTEYPMLSSSRLMCMSEMASSPTSMLRCKSDLNKSVQISGFAAIAADKEFKVIVRGIFNPGKAATTSTFRVASIKPSDSSIVDYLSTGLTAEVLAPPLLLEMYNVTASTYTTSATADYTLVAKTTSGVTTNNGEVWLSLSDYDYKSEVFGLNTTYNCSAENYEASAYKSIYTSYNCTDLFRNYISLRGKHTQINADSFFRATFKGIKNPSVSGKLQPMVLATYDSSSLKIVDKSYSTAAANNIVELIDNKLNIYIDNFNANITVRPSVAQTFTIFTESANLPFKQTMMLTPKLLARNNTGITFSPESVQLIKGQSRASFSVSVAATTILSEYLIQWKLSGDTGNFYAEPANTVLRVVDSIKHTIVLDTIPTILVNTTIPLNINLPAAPISGFTVNMTTAAGITAPPVTFAPGQTHATFNLTVGGVAFSNSRLNLTLYGTDAAAYTLKSSSVFFYITKYDDEPPYLDSFVVNSPRSRLSLDITIQTTEACYFYYLFGERGLNRPANDTLMYNALNNKSTAKEQYGYLFVGGSFMSRLKFSGLKEENDYVLFGYLQDTFMREIDGVFEIFMQTADMDDTVSFQLMFTGTQPTEAQLNGDILSILRTQFGILTPSLLTYVSKGRRLQLSSSQAYTFNLDEDETNEFVSPASIVRYQANVYSLAPLFTALNLTLDTSFNVASSIKVVEDKRPDWIIYPKTSVVNENNATVICSVDTEGTVYLQVLDDDDNIPSSIQVASELGPFNEEAPMSYSQAAAFNKTLTFFLTDLMPTSSYTVLVTARNAHPKKPRVMKEDTMASINVITGAKIITEEEDSTAAALTLALWLLFSWL